MSIRFTGLNSAGLAKIAGNAAFSEWNQGSDVGGHAAGEANKDLKIGLDTGAIGSFLNKLHIAVTVSDGAGFLVETGRGENDVGYRSCFCEKQILNNDE